MTKPFWEGLRSSSRGPIPVLRAGHSGPDRDGGHLSAPEAHLDRLVLNLRVRCRTMRADTIGTNIIAEDAELHADVRRSSQVTKATEPQLPQPARSAPLGSRRPEGRSPALVHHGGCGLAALTPASGGRRPRISHRTWSRQWGSAGRADLVLAQP